MSEALNFKTLEAEARGIVQMSNQAYHAHPAIGSSSLKKISQKSPAHYHYDKLNPTEPTPAMRMGSAVHMLILERDKFETEFAVMPYIDGRTKEGKGAKEDFLLKNHGKTIITDEQFQEAVMIAKSVQDHPTASALLTPGHAEEAYFWMDAETNIMCKCKPDFKREGHILVDAKTTEDASPNGFQYAIAKYGYDLQAAYYLDGVSAVTGQTFDSFVFIAVEKTPPYAVAVYVLDEASIDAGRFKYRKALTKFAECIRSNKWPGYSNEIQPINLPSWSFPNE